MSFQLTVAAERDVRAIVTHIRDVQKSPQNARLVATRLRAHFRKLARFPGMGHVRDELHDPDVRVSAVTGVLVIYDPASTPLTILRVVHAARDLGRVRTR